MSMDYAACNGHCISYADLKALLPKQIASIESHPDFEDWSTIAENSFDHEDQLGGLVSELCDAFSELTTVNGNSLTLSILKHDDESRSKYDEVESEGSCVFEVSGVYQKTPAAMKFDHVIKEFSVVQFG